MKTNEIENRPPTAALRMFRAVALAALWLDAGLALRAEPPAFTCQPESQTNVVGSTITLTVCATGTPPLAYQWRRFSTVLAQETNATLVLANFQAAQAGNYSVIITNVEGAITSVLAYVRVLAPVSITAQPTNFPTLSLGASVSNRVTAIGTPSPTYQWQRDGVPVPGQTNAMIVVTNLQREDAGKYTVTVANLGGSVTSVPVELNVDPTFARMPLGEASSAESGLWNPYWIDYNGDGALDLVVIGGFDLAARPVVVFDNLGDGRLQRNRTNSLASSVTTRAGNLIWGDFDNDGDPDLYLTHEETATETYLRNDGQGRFTRVAAAAISTARGWTAAAADYDRDGWLDLLIGCWGNGLRTNQLLRGLGDGLFAANAASGLNLANVWADSLSWVDYDEDGDLDVFIGMSGPSPTADLLMVNRGDGVFTNDPAHPLSAQSSAVVTAGQSWADYDNDGDLDVAICRWGGNRPLVYRNLGGGNFAPDTTGPLGYTGGKPAVPLWGDYDNDGLLDLFIAYDSAEGGSQASRLFHNRGHGQLEEITTGSPIFDPSYYGAAMGDYDGDGFLDLATVDLQPGVFILYRNNLRQVGNTNAWLKVKLAGTVSNRSGVGAAVRARATIGGQTYWQRRQIVAKSSQPDLEAHFGLGDATTVERLVVEWPSGQVTELRDIAVRQRLTLTEPPGLRMLGRHDDGAHIEITAHPGMTVLVERTDALNGNVWSGHWPSPWRTLLQTNRTLTITDPETGPPPHRFYKARAQ